MAFEESVKQLIKKFEANLKEAQASIDKAIALVPKIDREVDKLGAEYKRSKKTAEINLIYFLTLDKIISSLKDLSTFFIDREFTNTQLRTMAESLQSRDFAGATGERFIHEPERIPREKIDELSRLVSELQYKAEQISRRLRRELKL